ncbi:hypothetical protein CANARDRAFT_27838 [[Candida] arabinofermentans NRRL YB-2248]|uniref:alanine--glyoxylate transaminase n=1 Tax=[Candida] arabinofermentans NRRL YB-2248 TaxID=983967 RepID=A0A1E4T1Y2_9ASCO|nr:hypothetical protein CANARDRAFT_27838 [[Candida] arabinofermentans NRRL YB-2248]
MSSARKLTFIPGPIEFSDAVLSAMSTPSQAHTSPEFVPVFQQVLKDLRKVFKSTDSKSQAFVLNGSGTLGWDIAGANLLNANESALVLSTGFFSDSFADALKVYTDDVDIIEADSFGASIDLKKVESALSNKKYNLITITQTDTSSGVLTDVKSISSLVKKISPDTLIVVDGVCATACEPLEFDLWGIDYALTASQKAIGVPSGLSISFVSSRALDKALSKEKPTAYFASLKRWLPIMKAYESGSGAYFATPAVQLIHALNVSLKELLAVNDSIDARIEAHKVASDSFKDKIESIGLNLVPQSRDVAAHGLSVIWFPEGVDGGKLLGGIREKGFQLATGIYKDYKTKYFRVGHMGVTAVGERKAELDQCFEAIKDTLIELGYKK